MRGSIIQYDAKTAQGIISGEDGSRYHFSGTDFESDISLAQSGVHVDFEIADGTAISVYVLKGTTNGQVLGEKSKIAAGLFALFLGSLGIHKFYLGQTTAGIIMLAAWFLGFGLALIPTLAVAIIALIEGIIYLTKSDEDFYQTYVVNKKAWF